MHVHLLKNAYLALLNLNAVQTGQCMHDLRKGHSDTVTALRWFPDGSKFISGSMDKNIMVWVGFYYCDSTNACPPNVLM